VQVVGMGGRGDAFPSLLKEESAGREEGSRGTGAGASRDPHQLESSQVLTRLLWGHKRGAGTSPAHLGWQQPACSGGCSSRRRRRRKKPRSSSSFQEPVNCPPMLPKKWPFAAGLVNPLWRGNPRECGMGG